MRATQHPEEADRLAALARYDILDTPRERSFDEIVELASRICEAPISLVSLLDRDRQWFKAEVGLGIDETPIDVSICSHAIFEDDFLEINDTLADPRSADNSLCLGDDGLRFYAGAVLKTSDGLPIGTLCVLDEKPRALTQLQRDALKVLGNQVIKQIEMREVIEREKILRKEIDHRVKNSLQSVGSFVALERKLAGSPDADRVLASVQQQVQTVALLHQHIGTGDGDGTIDLADYLARVVELFDQSTPPGLVVRGTFAAQDASTKQATALAMIVNELAANAVKHSFGDAAGVVTMSGESIGGGRYRITCADNGTTNTASDASKRTGLGLSIIQASVRQLGGTMQTERSDNGYRTVIEAQL